MAEENIDEDVGEIDEPAPRKGGGLKKIIMIVLPLVLVLGGGAAAYFTGALDALLGGGEEEQVEELPVQPGVYLDLDEMLVSLAGSQGRKPSFLKIRIRLQLEKASDEARIRAVMPRIVDNFQVFLRELRVEELQGSQGIYRVKEELLARVNALAHPVKIKDVLFQDMLVQ